MKRCIRVEKALDRMMDGEVKKCAESGCPDLLIRECWASKKMYPGQEEGYLEHRLPESVVEECRRKEDLKR